MIGVVYNGQVNYINQVEDFRDLMEPNVYDAMVEAIENGMLVEDYKEKYEDLLSDYESLQSDYEDLEYTEDELRCCEERLEKSNEKLSSVKEKLENLLKDIQFGYVEKTEDIVIELEKISVEITL